MVKGGKEGGKADSARRAKRGFPQRCAKTSSGASNKPENANWRANVRQTRHRRRGTPKWPDGFPTSAAIGATSRPA